MDLMNGQDSTHHHIIHIAVATGNDVLPAEMLSLFVTFVMLERVSIYVYLILSHHPASNFWNETKKP